MSQKLVLPLEEKDTDLQASENQLKVTTYQLRVSQTIKVFINELIYIKFRESTISICK